MKMRIFLLVPMVLMAVAVGYVGVQSADLADTSSCAVGLREFVFEDFSRTFDGKLRTLEVALWYPTYQSEPMQKIEYGIWKIKDAAKNAPIPSDTLFPLIIFSHGYSGNQWVNTWFSEYFAEHGYMVAVVRHYGNSHCNMIPELCARPWNRPEDMSFVLDQLLQHPQLSTCIDTNRIGAAGFSQGGMSCMWLAGAQATLTPEILKRQMTFIDSPELRVLHFKDIAAERLDAVLDNFVQEDFEQANRSYYDKRFKAIFAIAPGLDRKNIMFTAEGLAKVSMPTHITIGASDTELLGQTEFFATHIPECTRTVIPGRVAHLTMLNEGTEIGKLKAPFFTVDHPSVNRSAVHGVVAAEALDFFNKHLYIS